MDEIVKKALLKWPNVPACHGWLGLDERGEWYMRDARVQALGDFRAACASGNRAAKGARLTHGKLVAFINRNYECTQDGQWYFQNGPQRVYVEFAATPYVLRLYPTRTGVEIKTHTGLGAVFQACVLDAQGRLFVCTEHGTHLVHSQDVYIAAEAIETGLWSAPLTGTHAAGENAGVQAAPSHPS